MHQRQFNLVLATPLVLFLGLTWAGCSPIGVADAQLELTTIPSQTADTQVQWRLDLSPFALNYSSSGVSWTLLSDSGEIQGSEYVNTFDAMGSYTVQVRARHDAGGTADAEFVVVAQAEFLAVVQRGNDLDLFDGGAGNLIPMAWGGASPLGYKVQLPNSWFVYERFGGSTINLFVYDMVQSYEIGASSGLDTVYDNHSQDSVVFFEQGSASETGLYAWHPDGPWTENVAWRQGMHNRNAYISDSNVVYFEYGNNGQPDLYFWTYGAQDPTTAFSSDFPEVIQTILPEGGVIFSTVNPVTFEDDLYHYRMHNGSFTVGGDLPSNVQALDMAYLDHLSGSQVVFNTTDTFGNQDLWLWSPFGLNTAAVASGPNSEFLEALTPDDRILYSVATTPGNDDLGLYHHTTQTTSEVATTADNEVFEVVLANSDVVFAVESATGRQLKRYNVITGLVDVIGDDAGEDFTFASVLSNGMVVYNQTGTSPGLRVWSPGSGLSALVAGAGSSFVADAGEGDFILSLNTGAQTDLALWEASSSQLVMITQTPEDEQFECVFREGVVIYSRIEPPGITSDLFTWNLASGIETRITNGSVDYSVVTVVHGAP